MKPVRYNTDDNHPEAVYVHENGYLVLYDDYAALAAENEVLRKKVDWLQKASDLLIWNGTEWNIRKEILPK